MLFIMPLKHSMHDRNPYKKNPPNFTDLARDYPELRKHCFLTRMGTLNLNFNSAEAVSALSRVLLLKDFGLDVVLPRENLVPRVPQRFNYLLLIEDIIVANGIAFESVIGVDIGTGASCIYPLMGAAKFGWLFWATDIDRNSVMTARANVERNNLSANITVMDANPQSLIEDVYAESHQDKITFSLCNPPFYDFEEVKQKYIVNEDEFCENIGVIHDTRPLPHSSTVAKWNELATEGGEVTFVLRMVEESKKIRLGIRFYTSMLGFKTSLTRITKVLSEIEGVRHFVRTLNQGRTQRYIIVWTFDTTAKLDFF